MMPFCAVLESDDDFDMARYEAIPAAHRTAAWVWRQMIEATPRGQQPRYLIHDRDHVYGADFATQVAGLGVESVRTPVQSPRPSSAAVQPSIVDIDAAKGVWRDRRQLRLG